MRYSEWIGRLGALSLVVGLVFAPAIVVASESASTSATVENKLSVAELRADFATLYKSLRASHYDLYAHRSRADYDAYFRGESTALDTPLDRAEAARRFQRFVAYGRVAHAHIDAPIASFMSWRAQGGKMLPLFARVVDGKVYLLEAADADGHLPAGTEIETVDGEPALVWLDRLAAYVSADRPYMAYAQLEKMLPIAAWEALGPIDVVQVRARGPDGAVFTQRVAALSADEYGRLGKRYPTPAPDTDFNQRDWRLLGDGIAYLRPGPFYNIEAAADGPAPSYEASAYRRFIDGAFEKIIVAGATDLIVDLRDNPGGDNSFSDPMVAWFATRPFKFASSFRIKASAANKAWYRAQQAKNEAAKTPPDAVMTALVKAEFAHSDGQRYDYPIALVEPRPQPRFGGRVYVLVNRHSYSNATSVAALIQDYGFGRILGEETSDLPSSYASVVYFDLPHTGFSVTYPKSRFLRPSGDRALRGVIPDIAIATPVEPSATDTVLARARDEVLNARGDPGVR